MVSPFCRCRRCFFCVRRPRPTTLQRLRARYRNQPDRPDAEPAALRVPRCIFCLGADHHADDIKQRFGSGAYLCLRCFARQIERDTDARAVAFHDSAGVLMPKALSKRIAAIVNGDPPPTLSWFDSNG